MAIETQRSGSTFDAKIFQAMEKDNSQLEGLFFSKSPVMFCMVSNDGIFLELNPAFANNHGYNVEELTGKPVSKIFVPEVKSKFPEQQTLFSQPGHHIFESLNIRKDGSTFPVEVNVSAIGDEKGDILFRIVTVLDNSAYKNIEDQLRKLSRAVEQSPVSIVITDTNGNIEYANQKAFETTGYTLDELKGQNPRILKSGELNAFEYQILWETISSGKTWSGVFHNKRKDGSLYWESAAISPITNSSGTITHYLAIKEDITEKKKVTDDLIESEAKLKEANATKDKLFSIIAHDLRGPVGNFLPILELLTSDTEMNNDDRNTLMHSLIQGSKAAFSLLENLLFWSSSQSNTIKLIPAHYLIDELINRNIHLLSPAACNKSITISRNASKELSVFVDVDSVDLVVRNLLSNAIKFTPEGGNIVISAYDAGDFIEVEVADNGVGMSGEIAANLFKSNSFPSTQGTNKGTGSGLGLVMCRDFVEKNGGKIRVESIINEGSKFIFTLPKN